MNRREFLRTGGTAAVSMALPFGLGLRSAPPSCVIIGAGLAGLAAARILSARGWRITIVEARNRVGGRVFTHHMAGASTSLICELGAEWVGASHERVHALCRECGLELADHRFSISLLSNGRLQRPDEWSYSPRSVEAFERLRTRYERLTLAQKKELDAIDWWTCLERTGFTQEDLRLRDLFDSTDFGESIRHVSAYMAAAEYFESSPANEMDFRIVGGNSKLVDALVERVSVTIRLGVRVDVVRQRAGRVTVEGSGERFESDACICTVPSRMLNGIRFTPPLSTAHTHAADSLQYARIVKSSVLFTERFWKDDDFSVVSDDTTHYYFHSTKGQADPHGIFTSYTVGDKADVIAAQDERRKLELITRDLAPLDSRAGALARTVSSYAWQRDPFANGAYALYRPGQWYGVRPVLARPHGKILFAGEHLADWQGFMEGAIVSGEDAAKQLLD